MRLCCLMRGTAAVGASFGVCALIQPPHRGPRRVHRKLMHCRRHAAAQCNRLLGKTPLCCREAWRGMQHCKRFCRLQLHDASCIDIPARCGSKVKSSLHGYQTVINHIGETQLWQDLLALLGWLCMGVTLAQAAVPPISHLAWRHGIASLCSACVSLQTGSRLAAVPG